MRIDITGDNTMSKQIKLLMETFNKFLNEEESSFDNEAFKQELKDSAKGATVTNSQIKREVVLNDKFNLVITAVLNEKALRYSVQRFAKHPDGKTRFQEEVEKGKVTSQEEANKLMDFMTKSSEDLQSYLP